MLWTSIAPAFLASIVEFVEALTIVLAIGVSINWKSSLGGAAAAAATLALLVAIFGQALVVWVPLEVLRLVIGIILILFGLQWLKKSWLRYSGFKALHDEAKIYDKNVAKAQNASGGSSSGWNGFGFATSYKSVLLEGLEVAFIVISFGSSADVDKASGVGLAALGAALAFVLVVALGLLLRKPLTRVPENTLKFCVGVMLLSFGTFWSGEGLGIEWPGADVFLLVLIAASLAASALIVAVLRRIHARVAASAVEAELPKNPVLRVLWAVFDFFCGDWWVFFGVAVTLTVTKLFAGADSLRPVMGALFLCGIAVSVWLSLARVIAKARRVVSSIPS